MSKKATKKHLKLRKKRIFQLLALIVLVMSFLFCIKLTNLHILPPNYLAIFLGIMALINLLLFIFMSLNHLCTRLLGTILSFTLIFFFVVGINYQNVTLNFLHNLSFLNIQTENYNVITLKNGNYHTIKDLENKKIAYVSNRKSISQLEKTVEEKIHYQKEICPNISDLIDNLMDQNVDAIIMEQEEKNIYMEMKEDFKELSLVIDTLSIDTSYTDLQKDVQTIKEPFNIYLTGIDTFGKISNVSRSDVNIVVTINPLTHQVLLTSIPRDYYVNLHGIDTLKDKLTHAGLQGVDMSIKTIEDLLDIDINYYIKVNFTSLVNIVNIIDGIDINNPFLFDAHYQESDGTYINYNFKEGQIHLNGLEALAYSRERYNLREGDIARAKHQHLIIEAIVNKCLSKTILTKYSSLIKAIEGNFVTNMPLDNITNLLQNQIKHMPSWTIESQVLTGTNSSKLTYTFPKSYSYVMLPDEQVLKNAQTKIKELLNL